MAKKKSAVERKQTDPVKQKMRTNHLLIIGIDLYANGISTLNNAVRDAQMFKALAVEKFQFLENNITELYNEEATRSNILQTFGKLLHQLTDEDNLVFYYSGHGEQQKVGIGELGYWIPSDATLHQSWTYIPNAEIINLFKLSKAHHIFGIVDSCFSGSLFATRKLTTAVERIDSYPSRWLLTAGRSEVVSDGSLGQNSPFATSLLTYLKNTPDDAIWVSDLCNWVLKGMQNNTEKQTPRGEPLQEVGHYGGQFVFLKKGYVPPNEVVPPLAVSMDTNKALPAEKTPTSITEASTIVQPTITTFEDLKTYLFDLITLDLKKALDAYRAINKSSDSSIIQQLSRYNSNKNDFADGIITVEQRNQTNAKITHALTNMVKELEEEMVHLDFRSILHLL